MSKTASLKHHDLPPGSLFPIRPLLVGGGVGALCCGCVWWTGVQTGTGTRLSGPALGVLALAVVVSAAIGLRRTYLVAMLTTVIASLHAVWRVSLSWVEVMHMTAPAERLDALLSHGPWLMMPPILTLLVCPPRIGVPVTVATLLGTGALVFGVAASQGGVDPSVAVHFGARLMMTQVLLVAIMGVIVWTQLRIAKQQSRNARLDHAAHVDELTGLANRRAFAERLHAHVQAVRAGGSAPIALVLFDIDHFKSINDVHGHLVGDDVLRRFGEVLRDCCRSSDTFGRWGGEEFGGLFVDMDAGNAWRFTDRIRDSLSSVRWPCGISMTVSAGVVMIDANDNVGTVMQRADQALYDAKSRGRDQVVQRARVAGEVAA